MVNTMTITYPDEAISIVPAADQAEVPVAISFTVESDGALPDGTKLGAAIEWVDDGTGGSAAYYGQLCPPDSLRARSGPGRPLDKTPPERPGQRIA
jgi:S-methylmethionine-dependent homocysteine/selenocysteine methylase